MTFEELIQNEYESEVWRVIELPLHRVVSDLKYLTGWAGYRRSSE